MSGVVVLAGGVGGARFLRGVREAERRSADPRPITAIVNTGDDAWLAGLRITPDLDSIMYTLAGVNDEARGWGRVGESERVSAELRAYGVGWPWFTLGDLDLGTHIARTSWLREGLPLSAVVDRLQERWPLGIRMLPMSDDQVETHVEVEDGRLLHFQEWWTRYRASLPARRFVQVGIESAEPAPGVLDAISAADVILLATSNPVVSIGTVLAVRGIRDAVRAASAPVIGVSPIIAGAAVRGMADACLQAIGVETSAAAVARHYGPRRADGLLDGWLVDDADRDACAELADEGVRVSSRPLLLKDLDESAAIVDAAYALAAGPGGRR
ncbi:MAG: 2-phospho-L-lactate transferase [Naasia sp.]